MLKNIVMGKRKEVYYNTEKKSYISIFKPKFQNKIKFFLKLRKYPGHNFQYIAEELNKLGLRTPEILSVEKYKVEVKEVEGALLQEYSSQENLEKHQSLWFEFIESVILLLNSGIYSGDLNTRNFIVSSKDFSATSETKKLVFLDLEDFRKTPFLGRDNKEALRRLKGKVPAQWIYEEIEKKVKI